MTATYGGYETGEDESFMAPKRYRAKFQCAKCQHVYFSPWAKAPPRKDLSCPRPTCDLEARMAQLQRDNERLAAMLTEQRAPPQIGANTTVRAVDATAEIVMQDYGMTDLKDNVRQGDSVAPKLPVEQQKAADNYFGGGSMPVIGPSSRKSMGQRQMDLLGRRAIAGAFKGMAVTPAQIMPTAAVGQPALTRVGVRSNDMARPGAH